MYSKNTALHQIFFNLPITKLFFSSKIFVCISSDPRSSDSWNTCFIKMCYITLHMISMTAIWRTDRINYATFIFNALNLKVKITWVTTILTPGLSILKDPLVKDLLL